MVIIAWIVLIFNIFSVVINFISMFTEKKISSRIASFIGLIVNILTCIINIFIIRM